MAEVSQWVHGLKTLAVIGGAQSLGDVGFSATTKWAGAGDWSDTISGTTSYTHSAGSGSLTQVNGDQDIVNVASSPYRLSYVLSSITGASTITMTLTTYGATLTVDLPVVAGTNTVDFTSGALTNGSFVISVVSTAAGGFTMDDISLIHGSAETMTTRSRLEVLDFTVRAEASNTGIITVVDSVHDTVGFPINAGDVGSWSAQDVMDTLDITNLFFSTSVATDGFHFSYRK